MKKKKLIRKKVNTMTKFTCENKVASSPPKTVAAWAAMHTLALSF
jgi:hypothetical protein